MKVGLVRFPDTTGAADALRACAALGWEARPLEATQAHLPGDLDLVLIPGGDPDGAALAAQARSPLAEALRRRAAAGGRLLGLGAGFAFLCEAGLLPGALGPNAGGRLVHGPAPFRLERNGPWRAGRILTLPLATRAGAYTVAPEVLVDLELSGAVLLRFCGPAGEVGGAWNPTGAQGGVAGLSAREGRVLGLLPQLERSPEGGEGLALLRALAS